MKNPFEDIPVEDEIAIDSEQGRSRIIDSTATWLIMQAGGSTNADDWVIANNERFRVLINDPQNRYIERLANSITREATLNEIKIKLSH